MKRRPVPSAWRETNHRLYVRSRYHSGGGYAGSRIYRAHGECSCGVRWPTGNANNLERADILDLYADHVEAEYYGMSDMAAATLVAQPPTHLRPVPLARYLVCVQDPDDGVGSRYYGPFTVDADAEAYAAPLRGNGVHASVHPLWKIEAELAIDFPTASSSVRV